MTKNSIKRCEWAEGKFDAYVAYHDEEWGVPTHDDQVLFEFIVLESAQAGLSWATILQKREGYRKAFENFDVKKVANFSDQKILELTQDTGIVRNKLKIAATVNNVKQFIKIQEEFGSFDKYIWGFVDNKPIQNNWKKMSDVPATTPLSDQIAKDLKKRGFKFMGSTTVYAFMQAVGLVNDHTVDCFRHSELA